MKKSLRFASAALALTLAAGMTLPAFAAAKADYSKDEHHRQRAPVQRFRPVQCHR